MTGHPDKKKPRFGAAVFGAIFMAVLLMSSCGFAAREKTPVATKGLLDLSGRDPGNDEVVKLEGEWEFYANALLTPANFLSPGPSAIPRYIQLPGTWTGREVTGRDLKSTGPATYRLRIRGVSPESVLSITIPATRSSYRLWVNGRLLASFGRAGPGGVSAVRGAFRHTAPLDPRSGDSEVVIQASSFFFWTGVVHGALRLGREAAVAGERQSNIVVTAFLSGALLIMGFYHLSLFFFRRKDRSSLYFGLFCLLAGFYSVAASDERLAAFVLPTLAWEPVYRSALFAYIVSVPVIFYFLRELYPDEIPEKAAAASTAVAAVFFIVAALANDAWVSDVDRYYNWAAGAAGLFLTAALAKAALRGREGARLVVVGGIILYAAVTNDILYGSGLTRWNNASPAGVFCFILSHSAVLSKRFSRAFSVIEQQEQALEKANRELDAKVRERTLRLEKSVQEKEILLREVHHRVKNNMQVIVSLLNLQSDKVRDGTALQAIADTVNRIKSLALVHEKLYQADDIADIEFAAYAADIVSDLFAAYDAERRRIGCDVQADGVTLDMDCAMSCALIINELATNSLKHAFGGRNEGAITIGLSSTGTGEYQLTVSDDGAGLPEGFDPKAAGTLGMRLVYGLVQRQLQGEIELSGKQGTRFAIRFRKRGRESR